MVRMDQEPPVKYRGGKWEAPRAKTVKTVTLIFPRACLLARVNCYVNK